LITTLGKEVGMTELTWLDVKRANAMFLSLNRWSTRASYELLDCTFSGRIQNYSSIGRARQYLARVEPEEIRGYGIDRGGLRGCPVRCH